MHKHHFLLISTPLHKNQSTGFYRLPRKLGKVSFFYVLLTITWHVNLDMDVGAFPSLKSMIKTLIIYNSAVFINQPLCVRCLKKVKKTYTLQYNNLQLMRNIHHILLSMQRENSLQAINFSFRHKHKDSQCCVEVNYCAVPEPADGHLLS